jgi:hypothetical protein
VAIGLIVEFIGEAIEAVSARIAHRRSRTVEWLREVTRPPPGLQLQAPDGSIYTGLVVFDANRAVVVVALRRLRQDQQHQYVDVQSEFPFGHRGAARTDGADDSSGRLRY